MSDSISVISQVRAAAGKAGVPPNIGESTVWLESSMNLNTSINKKGAVGPMQVTSIVAKDMKYNFDDLRNDPDLNLECGMGYLNKQIEEFGVVDGMGAYNWGPTAVRNSIRKYGPNWASKDPTVPVETKNYMAAAAAVMKGANPKDSRSIAQANNKRLSELAVVVPPAVSAGTVAAVASSSSKAQGLLQRMLSYFSMPWYAASCVEDVSKKPDFRWAPGQQMTSFEVAQALHGNKGTLKDMGTIDPSLKNAYA